MGRQSVDHRLWCKPEIFDGGQWPKRLDQRGLAAVLTQANKVFWNGQIAVAVGEGTNTIATSTDLGTTWTGRGTSTFSTRGNAIMWNDKRWIAGGTGTNTLAFSNDGITWTSCKGATQTEVYGLGANSKIGVVPVRSAITLNNRDKVCINTPRYYDTDLADDTSLVFNLAV